MTEPHARALLASIASRYARPLRERWAPVMPELDRAIALDDDLAQAARRCREELCASLRARYGSVSRRGLEAMLVVPRERFVLPEDIASSADDAPVPLDSAGLATVSAPHAYLLTFGLLDLSAGDHLLELGTGTGYGAALGREVVGSTGRVTTVEIDADLHARASRLLAQTFVGSFSRAPVEVLLGDARAVAAERIRSWRGPGRLKVAFTFALGEVPADLESSLPERACLVAPVGVSPTEQELVRIERRAGVLWQTPHGAVRYVAERRAPWRP